MLKLTDLTPVTPYTTRKSVPIKLMMLIIISLIIISLIKPALARYIFEPTYSVISNKDVFAEVMYDRLLCLIHMIEKDTFDLSEYVDMFTKAADCDYKDDSLGII